MKGWNKRVDAVVYSLKSIAGSLEQLALRRSSPAGRLHIDLPPPRAHMRTEAPRDQLVFASKDMLCVPAKYAIPAGGTLTCSIGPQRSDYLEVKGLRMVPVAQSWPSVEQRVEIVQMDVNCVPVPGHASTSDYYYAPVGSAVSLQAGVISNLNLVHHLNIKVRNENRFNVMLYVELFGFPLASPPPGVRVGLEGDF